ncbi:flagellar hook-basal body complex protein FliE [Aminipila butyrica]|uniref:Flagellar hook-basal body complex protein FliE n=2 Tax=Aminipila butyrica TaxID=433296 RepID=A0A858BZI3_9FIRM|nr:flagellar hook-basal body complex protein FliE [Aminipila butyrica]
MQAISTLADVTKIKKIDGNQPNISGVVGTEGTESAQGAKIPFKSFFEDAIQDVISTDQQVNVDAQMLATGQSDNLHQYSIDIAKAQLSIDLLVEMRNKALDSYSEIMRMSV